jgi:hypothetical protein
MTKAQPRAGEAGTGAYTARRSQVTGPAGRVTAGRGGSLVHRVIPVRLVCSIRGRAQAAERDAWLAVVSVALGTLEAGFSEVIPGSLAAGSAAGGVIYDSYARRRLHQPAASRLYPSSPRARPGGDGAVVWPGRWEQ